MTTTANVSPGEAVTAYQLPSTAHGTAICSNGSHVKTKNATDFPEFPIEPVLLDLGAESVPTGFGWVKMRCPFHDDRTASAAVNHGLNAFTCHGCETHGDSVKLIQTQLGLSVGDAIRRAQELTGVESRKPQRKRRASSTLLSFSRD